MHSHPSALHLGPFFTICISSLWADSLRESNLDFADMQRCSRFAPGPHGIRMSGRWCEWSILLVLPFSSSRDPWQMLKHVNDHANSVCLTWLGLQLQCLKESSGLSKQICCMLHTPADHAMLVVVAVVPRWNYLCIYTQCPLLCLHLPYCSSILILYKYKLLTNYVKPDEIKLLVNIIGDTSH